MLHPFAPISFAVEITYDCNNACSGCANAMHRCKNGYLHDWKALFDRIAPPENRSEYAELIRVTGGEPTLHDDFRNIVQYIDSLNIPHALFTNGRWKNPDDIIQTLKACNNFLGLLISLHGSDAPTHCRFVGGKQEAFDETCQTIKKASKAGLSVFTNTVLNTHTCIQINDIIDLSLNMGAECAVFNRFLTGGHPLEPAQSQLKESISIIEAQTDIGKACRIGNCIPPCFIENRSEGANAGFEHCTIAPDGTVRPDNLTRYSFGNIFEFNLEQIWGSPAAHFYRKSLPDSCYQCDYLYRCRGGEKSLIIEYGLKSDTLMTAPIKKPSKISLEFNSQSIPVPNYRVRKESFGLLLFRYNWSIPLSGNAKPIIEAIDGDKAIGELYQLFGDPVLEIIAELYEQNFLCIQDPF